MMDLKLDREEGDPRIDNMAQGVLGRPLDRPDAPLKVAGRARYAAEDIPANAAFGVLARAPGPIGRVASDNAEEVRKMPGVLRVLTDPRLLRHAAQGTANEAPSQGPDEALYVGQPLALVVAESFEAARHGAHAMRFEIVPSEGPAVDPESDGTEVEEDDDPVDLGDLDAAMEAASCTVDAVYRTPSLAAAAMEPHAALAEWTGGRLTLRGGLQMLRFNRNELADALGVDAENVTLLAPYVGGGFGSKLGIAPEAVAAALAAREVDRPVLVVQSRRQVFETAPRRSETRQRIRLAADVEGRLAGLGHETLVSNLPGEAFAEPVAQATHFAYAAPARRIAQRIARINRSLAGSVRAPGEAVGVTAFEIAMDELAVAGGIDPVELRRRNIPDRDPETGAPFSSHRLAEALDDGAARFGWKDRAPSSRSRREGEWWIGSGMAAAFRVNMVMDAEARVTLDPRGVARVETDMTDIGTGTYAILGQVAGEMLGLDPRSVEVRLGDTAYPPGSGSGGSVGAASNGTAVYLACRELRAALAERMGCDEADLVLKDGQAVRGNRRASLSELLDGETLTGEGRVSPGEAASARRQATFGAHFAQVAVNDVTGETRVRRMTGSFAAGRILNEKTARSQCFGGMTWGIGMALTEALHHDPRDGHAVNRDLAEYHVPVNADVPTLDVSLVPERDGWAGPLAAKGIGELGICGAAAAVLNAIHHASGVRIRDLPATPDKVLAGLLELP